MRPAAEAEREEKKRNERSACSPPFHAKGVSVCDSRRSPGLATSGPAFPLQSWSSGDGPNPHRGASALQLRGSAGFAPASQPSVTSDAERANQMGGQRTSGKVAGKLNVRARIAACQWSGSNQIACGKSVNQSLGIRMRGRCEHALSLVAFDDLAAVQNSDAVADARHREQIV